MHYYYKNLEDSFVKHPIKLHVQMPAWTEKVAKKFPPKGTTSYWLTTLQRVCDIFTLQSQDHVS